jgi:hypothetical protein
MRARVPATAVFSDIQPDVMRHKIRFLVPAYDRIEETQGEFGTKH